MIDKITKLLEDLLSQDSAGRLHTLFFRVYQLFCVISSIMIFATAGISAILSLGSQVGVGLAWVAVCALPLLLNLKFMILAEVGLRATRRGKILGFWIGTSLAILSLFGFTLPLGLFGLYAFLNPDSQRLLLRDAPLWLKKRLSDLKYNHIEPEQAS